MQKIPANRGVILLTAWMDDEGISTKRFAEIIGVSPAHMYRVMSGMYKPSLSLACKINERCGVPEKSWTQDIG